MLLQKARVLTEVYNDLDRDLVNMFTVIRERPVELAKALAFTPYSREEYNGLYAVDGDEVQRARRFIARSFMGMHSKGAVQKSGFDSRTNPDGYTGRMRAFSDLPDEIIHVASRFVHVLIEQCDAIDLVGRYDRSDAFIYLDPPYLAETRSGKIYNHEMTDAQHLALLERVRQLSAMVCISGYPSALYDGVLADWARVETGAFTDGAAARTEVLWINPAASEVLRIKTKAYSAGQGMPLFSTEAAL